MARYDAKRLWQLFKVFFKAGTFTFAGGLAMLPVIERDIVERYAMMDREEFHEYATLSQTLPGIIALNCATFVGRSAAGVPGMIAAGVGATISAFFLMIGATILKEMIPDSGPVAGAMGCIRAASAALILSAAFTLGASNIKAAFSVVAAIAAFSMICFLGLSAPVVVLIAGAAGYGYERIRGRKRGAA